MRKKRDTKLVTAEIRTKHLVSEPNYHAKKIFTEYLEIEMTKTEVLMNNSVCLKFSILELSKIFVYDF